MNFTMKSDCFIDTNIWVYAFLEVENSKSKQQEALELLRNIPPATTINASVQVINEFHWTLFRKYKIPDDQIRDKVEKGIAQIATISSLELSDYRSAFNLRDRYKLSFWDSLIIASALRNECTTLYTEDLAHDMLIDRKLRIINPFKQ